MFLMCQNLSIKAALVVCSSVLSLSCGGWGLAHQQVTNLGCFADVGVYDPVGRRLPFKVVQVSFDVGSGNSAAPDLLGTEVEGIRVGSQGSRITFSSNRIVGRRPLKATLQDSARNVIHVTFSMTSCRRRVTLFYGQSELGVDVNTSMVRGRLTGCKFDAGWWIRSLPLFGSGRDTVVEDGYVAEDGTFEMDVGGNGVRRVLFVGNEAQVIHSQGFNLVLGKDVDLGDIDLRNRCKQ